MTRKYSAETPEERADRYARRDESMVRHLLRLVRDRPQLQADKARRQTLHWMRDWSVATVLRREAEERESAAYRADLAYRAFEHVDRLIRQVPKGQVLL